MMSAVISMERHAPVAIDEEILRLTQEDLRHRQFSVGLVPGAKQGVPLRKGYKTAAIAQMTRLFVDETHEDSAVQQLIAAFPNINAATAKAALTTLRKFGLVENLSRDTVRITDFGTEWLCDGAHPLALVVRLHARLRFFGEILRELAVDRRTVGQLFIAAQSYGVSQKSELNQRLHYLRDADLIIDVSKYAWALRPLGAEMLGLLPLEEDPVETVKDPTVHEVTAQARSTRLVRELRMAGRMSSESRRLEDALADVLAFLLPDAEVEQLGGPGVTDVLLRYGGRTVIFDAKSSSAGSVAEAAVRWDALAEHRRTHAADYVVVVGERFSGRVPKWAAEKGVRLITFDELSAACGSHAQIPIPTDGVLDGILSGNLEQVATQSQAGFSRIAKLMCAVIRELEFSRVKGTAALSTATVAALAARQDGLHDVTTSEIGEVLTFLVAPPISAVVECEGGFSLVLSPSVVRGRLGCLSVAAADAAITDGKVGRH